MSFFDRFRKGKDSFLRKDKLGLFYNSKDGKRIYLHGSGNVYYFSADKRNVLSSLPDGLSVKRKNGLMFVTKR